MPHPRPRVSLPQYPTDPVDHVAHAQLEAVQQDEAGDLAVGLAVLDVPVLDDPFVRLDVGRPHDLFPVVGRIAPQAALWVGLNSGKERQTLRNSAGGERAVIRGGSIGGRKGWKSVRMLFNTAAEQSVPTCRVVPVSVVSPLFQDALGHPEEYTEVKLLYDFLRVIVSGRERGDGGSAPTGCQYSRNPSTITHLTSSPLYLCSWSTCSKCAFHFWYTASSMATSFCSFKWSCEMCSGGISPVRLTYIVKLDLSTSTATSWNV